MSVVTTAKIRYISKRTLFFIPLDNRLTCISYNHQLSFLELFNLSSLREDDQIFAYWLSDSLVVIALFIFHVPVAFPLESMCSTDSQL